MTKSCMFPLIASLLLLPGVGRAEYGDVVLDQHKDVMAKVGLAPVVFPHWIHRMRFKCKACHEEIFSMEKGGNDVTMAGIINGEFCGACHNGKIAWDPLYCDRCHSYVPVEQGQKKLITSSE